MKNDDGGEASLRRKRFVNQTLSVSVLSFGSVFRFCLSVLSFGSVFRFCLSVLSFGSVFRFCLS
ncbi:hypothetical protein, partial [Bartonella henselae]|uniref:hypothetical protein n=1 Tax=Bartonella henselae TaxID=38323 RepID=UPI001AEC6930